MKLFIALLRRQAADSRVALLAAPLAGAAALATMHAVYLRPTSVAEACAATLAALVGLAALYFGADLFAPDLESGRLATLARLPISASQLFAARVAFLALSLIGFAAAMTAFEWILECTCEDAATRAEFCHALPSFWLGVSTTSALAASAMVASLIADTALSAMFVAVLLVAAFGGAALGFQRAFELVGVQLSWNNGYACVAIFFLAGKLVAVAYAAFVRGQRKLGRRAVRVQVAVASVAAMLLGSAALSAAEIWRRTRTDLEDSWVTIQSIRTSPDAQRIAIELVPEDRSRLGLLESVWTIELDSGERKLVSRQAELFDLERRGAGPWADADTLEIARASLIGSSWDGVFRVALDDELARTSIPSAELRDRAVHSRAIAPWAEIHPRLKKGSSEHAVVLTWKARGISSTFEGSVAETLPGVGLICAPREGIVWHLRAGKLSRLDLESGADVAMLDGPFLGLRAAPDGAAFLAQGTEQSCAIDADSGQTIGAPWPASEPGSWVEGCAHHRFIRRSGRGSSQHIVDLVSGASFELSVARASQIWRVGDRGYVYVARDGDLLWIDDRGQLIRRLVERTHKG